MVLSHGTYPLRAQGAVLLELAVLTQREWGAQGPVPVAEPTLTTYSVRAAGLSVGQVGLTGLSVHKGTVTRGA